MTQTKNPSPRSLCSYTAMHLVEKKRKRPACLARQWVGGWVVWRVSECGCRKGRLLIAAALTIRVFTPFHLFPSLSPRGTGALD